MFRAGWNYPSLTSVAPPVPSSLLQNKISAIKAGLLKLCHLIKLWLHWMPLKTDMAKVLDAAQMTEAQKRAPLSIFSFFFGLKDQCCF